MFCVTHVNVNVHGLNEMSGCGRGIIMKAICMYIRDDWNSWKTGTPGRPFQEEQELFYDERLGNK